MKWARASDPCNLAIYRRIQARVQAIKAKGWRKVTDEDRATLAKLAEAKLLIKSHRLWQAAIIKARKIRRHLGPKYMALPLPPNPLTRKAWRRLLGEPMRTASAPSNFPAMTTT
jgi:hypothetical protein